MTNQKPWQTGKIRTRNCGSLQPLHIMKKQKKDPLLGNNESLMDRWDSNLLCGIFRFCAYALAGSGCQSFDASPLPAFLTYM